MSHMLGQNVFKTHYHHAPHQARTPHMLTHRAVMDKSFSQSWSIGKWRTTDNASSKAQFMCQCESVQTIHTKRKCKQENCKHCDFESICLMRDISELSSTTSILDAKAILSLECQENFSRSACLLGSEISRISIGDWKDKDELWNFTKETNSQTLRISADDNAIDVQRLSEWCDGDTNLINAVLKTFCEQGRNHYIDLMQAFAVMDLHGLSFHAVSSPLTFSWSSPTTH
jgi:hypothetical protein